MPAEQLGQTEVHAAWRSVSLDTALLTELAREQAAASTPEDHSENSFQVLPSQDCIKLTNQQIIALAENLIVTLPGLTQFHSAHALIAKKADVASLQFTAVSNDSFVEVAVAAATIESEQAFALRKLSALSEPLFSEMPLMDDDDEDKKQLLHKLNDWHRTINKTASALDRALAETAYFYDAHAGRLIIRHASIDVSKTHTHAHSRQLLLDVTNVIKAHIITTQTAPLHIEHVIPIIKEGRIAELEAALLAAVTLGTYTAPVTSWAANSRHIVLQCISNTELQENTALFESGIIDPRQALFDVTDQVRLKSDISLGAQSFWDNVNCGRFVTIMAPVAALILANNPEKNAHHLTKADFEPYRKHIISACNSEFAKLRRLLLDLERKTLAQLQQAVHSKEFLVSMAANVAATTRAFLGNTQGARPAQTHSCRVAGL